MTLRRTLGVLATSGVLLFGVARCSSFNSQASPPEEAGVDATPPVVAPPTDGGDGGDPDACVPFLSDDFVRSSPVAAPWTDSVSALDGGVVEIQGDDAGVYHLVIHFPPNNGESGFALLGALPPNTSHVELDYDQSIQFADADGGVWSLGLALVLADESDTSHIALSTGVYAGVGAMTTTRKVTDDAGSTSLPISLPIGAIEGHVKLTTSFGPEGYMTVTVGNGTQSTTLPFPSAPTANKAILLGANTGGPAFPEIYVTYSHVRACAR